MKLSVKIGWRSISFIFTLSPNPTEMIMNKNKTLKARKTYKQGGPSKHTGRDNRTTDVNTLVGTRRTDGLVETALSPMEGNEWEAVTEPQSQAPGPPPNACKRWEQCSQEKWSRKVLVLETSRISIGIVNWCSHNVEKYGGSLKTRNWATIWHSSPTSGHIPWEKP